MLRVAARLVALQAVLVGAFVPGRSVLPHEAARPAGREAAPARPAPGRLADRGGRPWALLPAAALLGLVALRAHKKAGGTTANKGNTQPKGYGLKQRGFNGNALKVKTIIASQKGLKYGHPGRNVKRAKNDDLFAMKDGILQWVGEPMRNRGWKNRNNDMGSEALVVPWEYVNEKCEFLSGNTLVPKKYEPWMGKPTVEEQQNSEVKLWIAHKRKEWLESEEGKAYLQKKKEKKEKKEYFRQKHLTIKAKIWAKKKNGDIKYPNALKKENYPVDAPKIEA